MTDRFDVVITDAAEADLEAIYDWIAVNHSAGLAKEWLDKLVTAVESLDRFPSRGSLVPEAASAVGDTDVRQLSIAPYRVIYEPSDGRVAILMVVDARRDIEQMLRRRLLAR